MIPYLLLGDGRLTCLRPVASSPSWSDMYFGVLGKGCREWGEGRIVYWRVLLLSHVHALWRKTSEGGMLTGSYET